MTKKCSLCGAEVTYDGTNGCSVVCGKDENGCSLPAHPDPLGIGVKECWKQGVCPCCGQPTLTGPSEPVDSSA
jgi:hypothetical protein